MRLPLAVLREPAIAEGARSLSAWVAIRRDLDADPALADLARKDPAGFFARYGISGGPGELDALLEAVAGAAGRSREG